MAKCVMVQISDDDYEALVEHLAKDRPGRALVAVVKDMSEAGSFLRRDVAARRAELAPRFMLRDGDAWWSRAGEAWTEDERQATRFATYQEALNEAHALGRGSRVVFGPVFNQGGTP